MSKHCREVAIPLMSLKPRFVEFTPTAGVLRCMTDKDDTKRAAGMIFFCPKCKHDKQLAHYNIFLFPNAPEKARPRGRFVPLKDFKGDLVPLQLQSLDPIETLDLHPADVPCRWRGKLISGKVFWRPGALN